MKIKIFLLLLISVQVVAQKGSVKGRIYDSKTNQSLESATVIIQGTGIGTRTDVEGNYEIKDLTPGFKKIVVSLVGYQSNISPEFQVQGNQVTFLDLAMNETAVQLKEVSVRQNFNLKKIESPLSVLTIGVQDIEKSAGANRDVSKALQALPGVGATDPSRNDLIVRGGGPSENVFFLDGIEIPVINHFATQGSSGGAVGVINPDFVREVSFYTGAFPANRGNALSSVMEIRQKDGSKDRIHAKLSVGASDAALTVDGPVNKNSTFIVSARQSYLQFLFSAIGLPFLPTYNDFQLKYKWQINKKNELSIVGIGAIDDMVLNSNLKNPTESQRYILNYLPTYKQWNYGVGAVYKHFSDTHYDTWVLSRNMLRNSNFKYPNNNESLPRSSDYRSDEAENKLRFEQSFPDSPLKLLWGFGMKYAHYTNDTQRDLYRNNALTHIDYSSTLSLFGYQAFAQVSKAFNNERLKLSGGLNVTGSNFNASMRNPLNQFAPRFSVSYALSPVFDINLNAGRYTLQPSYTSLGYRNSSGELVNESTAKYIASNQLVVGLEYKPQEKMKMSVESFYKHYQYYPVSVADGFSIASKGTDYGQIGDEQITSTGKGRAYGVEFLFKVWEMNNLNLTATYTLFKSEFTDAGGQQYFRSSWDVRHLFNLISSYKFPKNWNVAMRWHYSGGAPYSPIDPISYNRVAWNVTHQSYPDYKHFNSLSLNANHQLDVRVDKEFYYKKWLMNLYVDVQNAYNFKAQRAPIYTNLDTNANVIPDPNGNPDLQGLRLIENTGGTILPTIGIIIKM